VIDLAQLTIALADTLQQIPELVAQLANQDPGMIVPFVDENPKKNSLTKAIYEMPPGSVLVAFQETQANANREMEAWIHRYNMYARAAPGAKPMDIVKYLVDGVPVPGDGMRWRRCSIMDGVLPAEVAEITRVVDAEGVDYFAVMAEFKETGDYSETGAP
jgi:hypothetical protein